MKLKSYRQEGIFKDLENDSQYTVEILHSEAKELYNIYSKGDLLVSVYREYKKDYKVDTVSYGDFKLFERYENLLLSTKFVKMNQISSEKQLCEFGLKQIVEETNIKVSGKSDNELRVDGIYQKSTYIESDKVDFCVKSPKFEIDMKIAEYNYKKKIAPLQGIEYESRSTLIRMQSSVALANIRSLSDVGREKDLTWLESKNYEVVQDMKKLEDMINFLRFYTGPIAVDTETTGLSINRLPLDHPKRSNLVGICISWSENTGYYIPTRHKLFDNLPETETMEKLRFILEKKHIVTHYGIFDWKVFWGYGINLNILDDTYILQYLVDVKQAKATKKLKAMSKMNFDVDQIELEDFFPSKGRRKQQISFDMLPLDAVQAYGPADADLTLMNFNVLRPKLPKTMEYIYGQEIILLRNIAYTEYYGIKIDHKALDEEYEKTTRERDELEQEIYRLAGKEFNISSGKQLGELLYGEMGIPIVAYTKKDGVETSTPSTSIKAFKQLLEIKGENGKCKFPIIEKICDFKKKTKLITAFFNKLYKDMIDDFIFPRYNPAGAESGRIAGYGPNLQQTAGSIRRLFVGDGDDYYILDCDYSQIEYRVMASLAQEESLIELFSDPDADFHTIMASRLFGVPQEAVTSDLRKQSKALNFGIPYGMGDFSLAVQIHGSASEEAIEDAHSKRIAYLDSVPKVRDFFTQTKDLVMIKGYVETLFGRRREFPDVHSGDKRKVEAARRQAGNTRIQGTAADIMKIAYNRVCEVFKAKGYWRKEEPPVRVAASIHDELLVIAHKSINPWMLIDIMRTCMEIKLKDFAPLYIGASVGNSWADGKDAIHELPIPMIDLYLEELNNNGMHQRGVENPERYVYGEIYKYIDGILLSYMNDKAKLDTSSGRINLSYVMKVVTDKDIIGLVNKYYAVKDPNDKKKVLPAPSMEKCLKSLYTACEVYSDETLAVAQYEEYVEFNESEEFAELLESDDVILDDENEDFYEEQVVVDYEELRRHAIKRGSLKVNTVPFKNAVEQYVSTQRIMVLNGKCYITVDDLPMAKIDKLRDYLIKNGSKNGAYPVLLELGGKYVETGLKLKSVDRDALAKILEGRDSFYTIA